MPWRNAREHSRRNSQNGMTLGNLRQLMMLAAVAWTATCGSCPPLQNHAPQDLNWEPRGSKLRCTASTSVPRHTPSPLRPWPCVPCHLPSIRQSHRFSLNQCVASVNPDANACRRTVVTWYSCPWRWHRLNTHPNLNKPTSMSSHKTQRWICKPWTESCCQSFNLPRFSLLAPPALAQTSPCYKASLTSSSCPLHLTSRCVHAS